MSAIDHHKALFEDFSAHFYPMGKQLLEDPRPVPGYFYSAFSALLLVPFGALDPVAAMWGWGALQVVSLLALGILPLCRRFGLTVLGVAVSIGVWATSFPLLHNFTWGQVSVPLVVCVIGAFCAYADERRVLAGVLIAFAAAIKYYPAMFLLYFIARRDVRACASFAVAAFAFYVAIPVSVIGPCAWLDFERASLGAAYGMGWPAQDVNSQYVAHVGLRWFKLLFQRPASTGTTQVFAVTGYAIALSNVLLLWRMHQRRSSGRHDLSLILLLLCIPFVVKTSWPHYLAYLPFCQVVLLSRLSAVQGHPRLRRNGLCALALLSIGCSSVLLFNLLPHWSRYTSWGLPFIANALLLACVYGIGTECDGAERKLNGTSGGSLNVFQQLERPSGRG